MNKKINLVDKNGNRIGVINKLEAHTKGKLHEAFSIFVFNDHNELLIQKRALNKYHSGGLWSNTCCSHANGKEKLELAVHRRLKEEMRFDCELEKMFSIIYKTKKLANDLIEHEFDYIFFGQIDKKINILPNPNEVSDYRWIKIEELKKDLKINPAKYTEWVKIIFYNNNFKNLL